MKLLSKSIRKTLVRRLGLAVTSCALLTSAWASSEVDIAQQPFTSEGGGAKPNVMLLMDTSRSMGYGYMPDEWEKLLTRPASDPGVTTEDPFPPSFMDAQCNPVYYNPRITYAIPKKSDGTSYETPDFTNAPYDGYGVLRPGVMVDLSANFQAYDGYMRLTGEYYPEQAVADKKQAAYWYVYNGVVPSNALPYTTPCNEGALSKWTRNTPLTSAQRSNFAIWYSYYRTRINMIRSAVSLAFHALDEDKYRVGFITVLPMNPQKTAKQAFDENEAYEELKRKATEAGTPQPAKQDRVEENYTPINNAQVVSEKYLVIDDFEGAHKKQWFDTIFAQKPEGTSPAREGLARVGRHYAGRTDLINAGMSEDPVLDYCQANFTILTTDGYWNAQNEASAGGPVGLDGKTKVGTTDSDNIDQFKKYSKPPMYDGGAITKVTSQYEHVQTLFEPVGCTLNYVVTQAAKWTKTTQQQYRNERHTVQRTTSPQVVKSQTQKSTSQYLATRSQTLVVYGYPESWQVSKTNYDYSYTYKYLVKTRKQSTTIRPGTQAYKYTKTAKAATGDLKRPWQQELQVARTVTVYFAKNTGGAEGQPPNVKPDTCGVNYANCTAQVIENGTLVRPDLCEEGDAGTGVVGDRFRRTVCETKNKTPVSKPLNYVCATNTEFAAYQCGVEEKPSVTLDTGLAACPANLPASYGYSYDGKTGWFLTACTPGAITDSDTCIGDVTVICSKTKLEGQWEAWPNQNVACVRTPATELNGWVAKECETQADAVKVVDFDFTPCGIDSAKPGAPYNSCQTVQESSAYVPDATCTNGTSLVVDGGVKKQYQCAMYPNGPYAHNSSVCDANGNVKIQPSSPYWYKYSCSAKYFPIWTSVTEAECSTYPKIVNEETFTCAYVPASTETYTRQCKNASNQVISCVVESPANLYVDKPVSSCPAQVSATEKNNWVSVSCRTVTTGPTPSSKTACKVTTTGVAPSYIRVTCDETKLPPEDAATCQEKTAAAGDEYDITCQANPVLNHVSMEFGTCLVPANNGDGIHAPKIECIGNTPKLVFEDWGTPCTNVVGDSTNDYFGVECSTPAQATVVETGLDKANCVAQPGKAPDYKYITCTPEGIITVESDTCPTGQAGINDGSCVANLGQKWKFKQTYQKVTAGVSDPVTSVSTTSFASAGSDYYYWVKQGGVDYGVCQSTTNPPVKITPFVMPSQVTALAGVEGCKAASSWPCLDTATGGGGGFSTNSLADVAQYYYATDLRPNMNDAVPSNGKGPEDDNAQHQHMTTFVLGLGISGTLPFNPDYKKPDSTGTFANIRNGTQAWPIWPVQQSYPTTPINESYKWEDPRSIDDFWHTAVNGRGQFFSARDPNSVVEGLQTTFAGIDSTVGAGSAETVISPYLKAGSNISFSSSYKNRRWTGEITAATIDITTLALTPIGGWSVASKLDAMTGDACDDRNIFVFDGTQLSQFGTPTRCSAYVDNLGVSGNFDASSYFGVAQVASLSQAAAINNANAAGDKFVNYIRGQHQYEGAIDDANKKYYRSRDHVLGDIIHSQPVYVAQPNSSYMDAGYAVFKSVTRPPMLYVGANDGMLHAFYASTDVNVLNSKAAKEAWAYIPTAVMGKLHKLADKSYANQHTYFVNATPVVGDVMTSSGWKTILVGGLAGGGKGYFALDITNPELPKALWEFAPADMGFSFGQPLITQVGTEWKVILSSGYNNGSDTSSIYMLDPITGVGVKGTFAGEGLREVTAFVKNIGRTNKAEHLYAGDLSGNVWRIDTDLNGTKIAELKAADGSAQPITTPVIATKMNDELYVAVGTGKLLGISDMADASVQSVYGFKDKYPLAYSAADIRSSFKKLELATDDVTGKRTLSCSGTNCVDDTDGWFIDLPNGGERVDLPMNMVASTLVFISNWPTPKEEGLQAMCSLGGQSYINFVDFVKGDAVFGEDDNLYAGEKVGDRLTVGGTIVNEDNTHLTDKLTLDDGTIVNIRIPIKLPRAQGKRVSWKEIIQ